MKLAGLSCTLLLCLGTACTHTKSAAHPAQEERAAQEAENEPQGESQDGSKGGDGDGADKSEKDDKAERGAQTASAGGQAARADGDSKGDDAKKGEAKKAEDVEPEDIDVATSPQGLLEPGAMDKVRDKLGVAKGESVQAALRRFQREQDLPATGMLDQETVERLGLSPDEIFEQAER